MLLFPFILTSYGNLSQCKNENIFFVESVSNESVKLASFFCEYGKTQTYELPAPPNGEIGLVVQFNRETKEFIPLSTPQKRNYILRLNSALRWVKEDPNLKNMLRNLYIHKASLYANRLVTFAKMNIFSKEEREKMENDQDSLPLQDFEKNYGKRLLMNGTIISREEWGAMDSLEIKRQEEAKCEKGNCWSWAASKHTSMIKENYMANFNDIDAQHHKTVKFTDGRYSLNYYPVNRIIIHHTASKYMSTKEEGMKYMKELQKYHGITLGWSDIGYHYLIDGAGNIYEGREWGKYVLGAHVVGHNYGSVGISLMTDGYVSPKMYESLATLVTYLGNEYHLNIKDPQTVRKGDLSWTETGWVVVAHKELDSWKPYDPKIDMDAFRARLETN